MRLSRHNVHSARKRCCIWKLTSTDLTTTSMLLDFSARAWMANKRTDAIEIWGDKRWNCSVFCLAIQRNRLCILNGWMRHANILDHYDGDDGCSGNAFFLHGLLWYRKNKSPLIQLWKIQTIILRLIVRSINLGCSVWKFDCTPYVREGETKQWHKNTHVAVCQIILSACQSPFNSGEQMTGSWSAFECYSLF